ncbi:chemotaxis protein CheA [Marinitoga arctica]
MKMQFDKNFVDIILNDFTEEFEENLNLAENTLIEYEDNPNDNSLNTLMRAFHSIKGISRLLLSMEIPKGYVENIKKIEKIAHFLENTIVGKSANQQIDRIYEGIDLLKDLSKTIKSKEKPTNGKSVVNIDSYLKGIKNNTNKIDNKLKIFLDIVFQFFEYLENAKIYDNTQIERMSIPSINALKRLGSDDLIQRFQKIIEAAKNNDKVAVINNINEFKKMVFRKNKIENIEKYKPEFSDTIKIEVNKLNNIMNLINELMILKSENTILLKELYESSSPLYKKYKMNFLNFEKVTTKLENQIMKLKMIPIKELLYKYKRLIRELSKDQNKKINFEIKGGEIEIDRLILENLVDPLTHLIRNAVDHGIEQIDERLKNNKNEVGEIKVNVYYETGYVFIEVIDDGKGIDPEVIRAKAKEKGYNINLPDDEIINYIFEPGFSTSKKVTEISGRGVGMDIVKNNIEKLNGTISVETKVNYGTKFIIKIPNSMSVIDGVMFYCGKEKYIFPFEEIEKIVKLDKSNLHNYSNVLFIEYNNDLIPVYDLKGILENKKYKYEEIIQRNFDFGLMTFIIINYNEDKIAILVDKVIEENEFLIKPLPDYIKQNYIFGSTILGNGDVVLILKPLDLIL